MPAWPIMLSAWLVASRIAYSSDTVTETDCSSAVAAVTPDESSSLVSTSDSAVSLPEAGSESASISSDAILSETGSELLVSASEPSEVLPSDFTGILSDSGCETSAPALLPDSGAVLSSAVLPELDTLLSILLAILVWLHGKKDGGEDADDEDEQVDEDVEEDEPRGYAVQKTVNAVLAVLSAVLFFLTQPLVWRFRLVDWWTVLFVLLCGAALAMLIWKRKEENKVEETDEENMEDFAE